MGGAGAGALIKKKKTLNKQSCALRVISMGIYKLSSYGALMAIKPHVWQRNSGLMGKLFFTSAKPNRLARGGRRVGPTETAPPTLQELLGSGYPPNGAGPQESRNLPKGSPILPLPLTLQKSGIHSCLPPAKALLPRMQARRVNLRIVCYLPPLPPPPAQLPGAGTALYI